MLQVNDMQYIIHESDSLEGFLLLKCASNGWFDLKLDQSRGGERVELSADKMAPGIAGISAGRFRQRHGKTRKRGVVAD
jgi:hypothetical protein